MNIENTTYERNKMNHKTLVSTNRSIFNRVLLAMNVHWRQYCGTVSEEYACGKIISNNTLFNAVLRCQPDGRIYLLEFDVCLGQYNSSFSLSTRKSNCHQPWGFDLVIDEDDLELHLVTRTRISQSCDIPSVIAHIITNLKLFLESENLKSIVELKEI